MNYLGHIQSLFLITTLMACDADPKFGPPPIAGPVTLESTGQDSSTTEQEPDLCAAYLGCTAQCGSDECQEACAVATQAPGDICEEQACDQAVVDCATGVQEACEKLPACGGFDPSTESSSSGTGSESSSSG